MERVLCCALGVSLGLLAGCSHTTPIAKTRGTAIPPATKLPNRADMAARIETVEDEAERAKQAGDNPSALHAYRRLLLLDPGHVDAHHHLAVAADMEGEFSEAEQHYRAALAREPENADLHTSLGWSLFLQHRDGEALGELRRALELDPEHATALYNMGWLSAHRGEEAEALRYFRRGGTEAQAQALLTKVRLELEDRSSRNQIQRAVARLGAPSPRGRLSRNEESGGNTVQARAESEGAQPASQTRTVSLETEQSPVLESPDRVSSPDEDAEPGLLPFQEDDPEPAKTHLAERPFLPTVVRRTETLAEGPRESVTQEAAVGQEAGFSEFGVELPTVEPKGAGLADNLSATHALTDHRPVPATHPMTQPTSPQDAASPSAVHPEAQSTDGFRPERAEEAVDSGLPHGTRVASPADSWPAFSTRTLATVGRVMLGKPPAGRETLSRQAKKATQADTSLGRENSSAVGESTADPSHSEIDSDLMTAARLGLNFGQPASRRFDASRPSGDESE